MPFGLPAREYVDPRVLERERAQIFARSWQPALTLADLAGPNSYATADVLGEPLVFTRDEAQTLRAHANVCRHRGGAVAAGCGRRRTLQCRYHGWTYGLDGRLLHAPEMDGSPDFVPRDLSLASIACDTWGPFGFVHLGAPRRTLAETLGEIDGECAAWVNQPLHRVQRRDYLIECNWKVYVENYLEGYHVPIAHPGLNREIDYAQYRVEPRALHSIQHAPIKPVTDDRARRYDASRAGDPTRYYWVYPNWMLNVYPDNLSINIVVPTGPQQCLTIFEWYFADPNDTAAIDKTVAFSDEIQQEDIGLCEMVQSRYRSRYYAPGPLSAARENGLGHFYGLWRDDMAEAR